eukprot:scaffold155026_cov54-Attheya_sp.AAC.1
MKAQHKTLPDGTGMGQGWVLERNLGKARFTMQKREEEWKQQQHGGPAKWTSSWTSHERPHPNNQWRAQSQKQANHAYQMAAQGPPPQYQMAAQGPPPQYFRSLHIDQ